MSMPSHSTLHIGFAVVGAIGAASIAWLVRARRMAMVAAQDVIAASSAAIEDHLRKMQSALKEDSSCRPALLRMLLKHRSALAAILRDEEPLATSVDPEATGGTAPPDVDTRSAELADLPPSGVADLRLDRRHTNATKTDGRRGEHKGKSLVHLWIADMDLRSPAPVIEALRARVDHGVFGYGRIPDELTDVALARLQTHSGCAVKPRAEWLHWLPGVAYGMGMAVKASCHCDLYEERVVVTTPIYPPFLFWPRYFDCALTEVPLVVAAADPGAHKEATGPRNPVLRYEVDWDALGAALAREDTRLLLWCNPHNPVGRAWTRAEMARVASLCVQHSVVLCSDEVWGDLTFAPSVAPFTSALSLLPRAGGEGVVGLESLLIGVPQRPPTPPLAHSPARPPACPHARLLTRPPTLPPPPSHSPVYRPHMRSSARALAPTSAHVRPRPPTRSPDVCHEDVQRSGARRRPSRRAERSAAPSIRAGELGACGDPLWVHCDPQRVARSALRGVAAAAAPLPALQPGFGGGEPGLTEEAAVHHPRGLVLDLGGCQCRSATWQGAIRGPPCAWRRRRGRQPLWRPLLPFPFPNQLRLQPSRAPRGTEAHTGVLCEGPHVTKC